MPDFLWRACPPTVSSDACSAWQEVCTSLFSLWRAHHARTGPGGDSQDSCSGPQLPCELLRLWGEWAAVQLITTQNTPNSCVCWFQTSHLLCLRVFNCIKCESPTWPFYIHVYSTNERLLECSRSAGFVAVFGVFVGWVLVRVNLNWWSVRVRQECGLLLSSEGEGRGCYPLDGHILCKSCSARRIQDLSAKISTDC